MNEVDRQLKKLFAAAKPARSARIGEDLSMPPGFAARVVGSWKAATTDEDWAAGGLVLCRWGLGVACGVMVVCLVWNRNALQSEWSPAQTVANQVTEFVSVP
jgi:hypothetical protein